MSSALLEDGCFTTTDPRLIGVGLTPSESALLDCELAVSHAATYAALFAHGVHGPALTGRDHFDALHCEAVCFLPGGRFEFARDMFDASGHVLAVIIPASDERGVIIDLVAWRLDTGELATWRGAASILGEDHLAAPWIDCDGVRVFPGPAEWLRAERRGVVIIDPKRAGRRLVIEEERLIVADSAFGWRLHEILRQPEPRIFVDVDSGAVV